MIPWPLSSLLHAYMVLFTSTKLNYTTGSQIVLPSGFFASSPAQLKSIAAGSNLTLTDSNGVLTLAGGYTSLQNSLPTSVSLPLSIANPGTVLSLNYGSGLKLSNGVLIVDTNSIESCPGLPRL